MNVRVIHLKTGKIEEVSEGYARNYLIPRKLAKLASEGEVSQAKQKQQASLQKQAVEQKEWTELSQRLPGLQVELQMRSSDSGTLYERLHESDILAALDKQYQVKLQPSWLRLQPIKQVGVHSVKIQFPNSLNTHINVNIKAK